MCRLTIITTAGRPDEQSLKLAELASQELNAKIIPRQKRSVRKLAEIYDANVIVAGKNRYEYYAKGAEAPFFFHPNSAAFRLKRVDRGEEEPLLTACALQKGDTFLDCTLGIGSDSLLAAYAVGNSGEIIGLEADQNVAFIVKTGMQTYDTSELPLTSYMRNIKVIHANALEFLKKQEDNSFDVVYMDPMFTEVIEESTNFEALRFAGNHIPLTDEWVIEAKRVAKRRVVLKAHFKSDWFERYHFQRDVRLTAKFHYGVYIK
ncbi:MULTISPECIES: class I SAM-dependent methyltransferase [Solibacillus]|uniref:Class I SAM-dependent methyltransferase n=1 Tax=Solibacillus merdavium TaxID=2762218 RepID=A0ABR8XSN9_9BACL|nr:class I SAM-dependent methyltransferase [Solibacillus merdavium]MBD8034931.1 class I SAM-dependent methyltransferase [Solibacillus merdavium]